jgi:hypothetical protein
MRTNTSKSLALVFILTAVLTTPVFAAGQGEPKRDLGDRFTNVITRLVNRVVHLFDVYPTVPQP